MFRGFTVWHRVCRWLVVAVLAGPLGGRAATVNGHAYEPLADWSAANGLHISRNSSSTEFTVTGRNTRLEFTKDSDIAEVNGVRVAMSFPLAVDHGTPLVAQLDATHTLMPLAFPARLAGHRVTTICLDPGHGGKDTGYRFGSHYEKVYTLALAEELRDQLKAAGFRVFLTRSQDEFVELPERPGQANRHGADLFISLHFNCSTVDAAEVQGPETYCITPVGASSSNAQGEGADHGPAIGNRCEARSLLLAYAVQGALVHRLGVEDRNVRRARFAVLRDAEMPAILIENGYMSHPVEGRKIFTTAYRRQLAAAIVRGVQGYQRLTAPGSSPGWMTAQASTPLPHHSN
jgi:N-acetylmuramoyl-L-alanine amidase